MKRNLIICASIAILGILLGAFGTHSLKETLSPESLQSFETGVRYLFYHVLAVLFVNSFDHFSAKSKNTISLVFFVAIFFFSGSIFVISTGIITAKAIWFITPLGGLLFIIGWLHILLSVIKIKKIG